jgi:WD40 repeat protein
VVVATRGDVIAIHDAASGTRLADFRLDQEDGMDVVVWYSPDGRQIFVAKSGTLTVLDAQTGALLRSLPMKERTVVSPGVQRAITWAGGSAWIRNLQDGTQVGATLTQDGEIEGATIGANGVLVATVGSDDTVRLWNGQTGEPLDKPLTHVKDVHAVAVSPDGRWLAIGTHDNNALIWDRKHRMTNGLPLSHQHAVMEVAFSPDSRLVATASQDRTARIWDVVTGKPVGEYLGHDSTPQSLQFSADGRTLLTTSDTRVLRWNVPVWTTFTWSEALRRAVCGERLIGAARLLRAEDTAAAPILKGREGDDVCAGVASP